jgi:hypothetical protein
MIGGYQTSGFAYQGAGLFAYQEEAQTQQGGGWTLPTHGKPFRKPVRQLKREFANLNRIEAKLEAPIQDIPQDASLSPVDAAQALLSTEPTKQKLTEVRKLEKSYQIELSSIDAALAFIESRRQQILLEDELGLIFALVVGMDDES